MPRTFAFTAARSCLPRRRPWYQERLVPGGRRGFTLLEVTVAFGIFLTVLVAVWALLGRSNRHQELLWDEFVAAELAASALEQAFAADRCELTPPQGVPVQFPPLSTTGAEKQLGVRVVLHVAPVAGQSGLRELKAVVQWDQRGQPRTLTRTLLRRVTP
ncbi:MAG: prepilin-type N-terminal cleavage/methylation domain-containing protein [Planctomycetota bacterium]|nr:prepilin-type N-terminal cleavage/methylation domain-containing protein [Planctomycetota bacterium]